MRMSLLYKLRAQFSGMPFSSPPSVFFVPLPAKSEVSMHGEILSSLLLATPTWYTATLRLGGNFFVGKQLVWQILVGNRVSLLGCCRAVFCQALQQYTGCIF